MGKNGPIALIFHTLVIAFVLAPLVSQLVAAHQAQQPDAALCSALQPASAAPHLSHDDAFGACGYCNLLEHHVAMPSIAVPALTLGFAIAGNFEDAIYAWR
ncbi:DUF2946 family protein, partial [Burkholderia sp. SIMBA_051]|uniref:DUF2946 family protein n=1 Tax=Burkholderia sp. SIMBA_051 TaxID=3085792 RepID=UPI003979D443